MAERDMPLTTVIDELGRAGRREAVSVGEVLAAFEQRSLGFLLTLWGVLAAMPIVGDLPGASILFATLILISIAQDAIGRRGLWAPKRLKKREIERERFDTALEWTKPVTRFVDRLLKPRLIFLVTGRMNRLFISLAAALLALTYYPLAFVPFGVNAPATATVALGLGLMTRDGLLIALGYAFCGLTAYLLASAA